MKEYISGKDKGLIEDIKPLNISEPIEDMYFSNQREEKGYKILNSKVNQSTFMSIGLEKAYISNVDFSHCVFIDCYFKKAQFTNVSFTNCKFIKCNFKDVNLVSIDFRYAKFNDCFIDYDKIKVSLPKEKNLRWELCTNLALESLRLGNDDEFRKFYFAEKEASEQHNLAKFTKKEDYYKTHYSSWQSIEGFLKYIFSKMSKHLWGYGEKISYLIVNMFIVIFGFAAVYFFQGEKFKINGSSELVDIDVVDSVYVSICNFITISSDITTSNHFIRNLTAIEGFAGVVLMGFFVAALFRFINRR
jgi:hypothetical protein